MPPSEDALLLLRIVERHLRSLTFGLDEEFPAEDWGFTAKQALEKLLKCWIVLDNQEPPRSHDLVELAALAEVDLSETLLALQPFAVEARYRDGEFPLPARRELILSNLNELVKVFRDAAKCVKGQDR